MPADEVSFEPGVLLIKKSKVEALKKPPETKKPDEAPPKGTPPEPAPDTETGTEPGPDEEAEPDETTLVPTSTPIRVAGRVPPELWNRLGTRITPKLRSRVQHW